MEFGVYLGTAKDERVLLPAKNRCPGAWRVGDPVEVFLYKDSADQADRHHPGAEDPVWEKYPQAYSGGYRPDRERSWTGGCPRICCFPSGSRLKKVEKGDQILVALYIDKSQAGCAPR